MKVFDNVLPEPMRKEVYDFLMDPGWMHGWKSRAATDVYSFWHKHFAGALKPDTREKPYDCAAELNDEWCGPLGRFWQLLSSPTVYGGGPLIRHTLVRCYANGLQYGSDGTLHTDAVAKNSYTTVYYPHSHWDPNWGGETVFFNDAKTDIIGCVYPKPNRMVTFPGTMQHVARGVSRTYPGLRITLMFKTQLGPERGQLWCIHSDATLCRFPDCDCAPRAPAIRKGK